MLYYKNIHWWNVLCLEHQIYHCKIWGSWCKVKICKNWWSLCEVKVWDWDIQSQSSVLLLTIQSVGMNFIICLLTSFLIMKLFWVGVCISQINICLLFFQVLEQIIINRTILWEIEKFSNQTWPGRYIWRRKQTISHF